VVVSKSHFTLEDFLRLPEEEPPLEYEDGRVTQKVSPQAEHSRIQARLVRLIDNFAEPRRLALSFPELRVRFEGRSLVPDVAVFRWDRVQRKPSGRLENVVTIAPDIAIEITSPEQPAAALVDKCRGYVDNGVVVALLLDPDRATVRLFRKGQPEQILRGSDRIDLDEVLPGFELTVDQVFAALKVD
jgi:Uma2 family endonuclease